MQEKANIQTSTLRVPKNILEEIKIYCLIKFTIPVIHLAAVSMVSVNGISTLSMA